MLFQIRRGPLRNGRMGDAGVACFGAALEENAMLATLDLSCTGAGKASALVISEALVGLCKCVLFYYKIVLLPDEELAWKQTNSDYEISRIQLSHSAF